MFGKKFFKLICGWVPGWVAPMVVFCLLCSGAFEANGASLPDLSSKEKQVSDDGYEGYPAVALKSDGSAAALAYVTADITPVDEDDIDEFATTAQLKLLIVNPDSGSVLSGPTDVVTTSELPVEASIKYAPDGSQFVVAWAQKVTAGEDANRNIYFRRFQPDGTPSGAPVQVNTQTAAKEYAKPVVAFFNDGSFVVAMEGPDAIDIGCQARKFNSDGTPAGGEVTLNSFTGAEEDTPSIAVLGNNQMVLAYEGDLFGTRTAQPGMNGGSSIYYRIFDSSLNPVSGDDQEVINSALASFTDDGFKDPVVIPRPDSSFLIGYLLEDDHDGDEKAFGMFFDTTGSPTTGDSFQLAADLGGDQDALSGAYHVGSSGLAVAFRVDGGHQPYSDAAVIKFYDDHDNPVRQEEAVSSLDTDEADEVSLAIAGDRGLVAWRDVKFDEEAGENTDIFYRAFTISDNYQHGNPVPWFAPYDEEDITDVAHEGSPSVACKPDDGGSFALTYLVGTFPAAVSDEDSIDEFASACQLLLEIRGGSSGALISGPTAVVTTSELPVESCVKYAPDASQFVVAWAQKVAAGEDANRNIYFRRFQPNGTPSGAPVKVNTQAAAKEYAKPVVAFFNDGSFVVAMEGPDAIDIGCQARKFNSDGTPAGGEVTLNSFTDAEEDTPSIAVLGNNRMVLAYEGDLFGTRTAQPGMNGGSSIYYRIFDSSLNPVSGDDQEVINSALASFTDDGLKDPVVIPRPDNSFLIGYLLEDDDDGDEKAFGMFFNTSASPVTGDSVQLSSVLTGDQDAISGAYHSGTASLVVSWRQDGGSQPFADAVNLAFFDFDNQRVRAPERISSDDTAEADEVSLDLQGDTVVVAWRNMDFDSADGETTDIYFRLFDIATISDEPDEPVTPSSSVENWQLYDAR